MKSAERMRESEKKLGVLALIGLSVRDLKGSVWGPHKVPGVNSLVPMTWYNILGLVSSKAIVGNNRHTPRHLPDGRSVILLI